MKTVIFCGWGGSFSPPILKEFFNSKFKIVKIFSQGPHWKRLASINSNFTMNYKDNVAESIKREGYENLYEIIDSSNSDKVINFIRSGKIDYIITIGYGEILKSEIIKSSRKGTLNIHPGILPLNRGADPITPVILGKVKKAGVTIHYIDEGIDTGKIIISKELKNFKNNSFFGLQSRLGILASLMIKDLFSYIKNQDSILSLDKQDKISKYYKKPTIEDRLFDFHMKSQKINRIVKAFSVSLNNAYFKFKQYKIYVQQCEVIEKNTNYISGEIIDQGLGYIIVATIDSAVLLSNIHIDNYNSFESKNILNQIIDKKIKFLNDEKLQT